MTNLPPFLLSRDRILHGFSANDLAKRVRCGALVRVRHGVYVDGPTWRAMRPWQQYRVRVQAAAETFEKPTIFARHSSASVWDIPFIGQNHPVQALTLKNDGGRSRAGVTRHFAAREGLEVVKLEGLLVTGRVRTVLDLAAFSPFTEAIAPLDHVLRQDLGRQLHALAKAELEAGIGGLYSAAAARRIRTAIAFADPASASAGESWSRALIHVAGFEPPILQQRFTDAAGLVGYSDFYWKDSRVIGEFDGEEKYVKPEFLKGRTTSEVVIAEKNRENRLRSLGFRVERWDWADLAAAGTLERKLAAAGVARRRTRSAVFDAQNFP
ncbi:hypothetical protein J2S98_003197 [Arthrobacter oryzae]|uniref:hypothetical protein n=1 Tax=Arthrobacter oryzae TaxID=409290 RepID=UPI00277E8220|nr:hypothetical protein [Arthrobacter oryzae]MDP9988019.1 hypothetical protein [Arthrobacter oryzae]